MAPRPTLLKLFLEHTDDEEITCLLCGLPKCDQEFVAYGKGKTQIMGVHNSCVEWHAERTMKRKPAGEKNGTS